MIGGSRSQVFENQDDPHLVLIQHLEDFLVLLPPVVGDEDRIVFSAPLAVLIVRTAVGGRSSPAYAISLQPEGSKSCRRTDASRKPLIKEQPLQGLGGCPSSVPD